MKIRVDILAWNEAETIAMTIRHYQDIADDVIIWDNHSTDDTAKIALAMGCIVQPFGKVGVLDDRDYLSIKNAQVTATIYDWRIVCDADEILCINRGQLEKELEAGTEIIRTKGWNIYSDIMPKRTWAEVDSGFWDPNFNKQVCYNPSKIKSMNFNFGAHSNNAKGKLSKAEYILRHYRCVGGVDRMINRHAVYKTRMSPYNIANRLSFHYLRTKSEIEREWSQNCLKSKSFSEI